MRKKGYYYVRRGSEWIVAMWAGECWLAPGETPLWWDDHFDAIGDMIPPPNLPEPEKPEQIEIADFSGLREICRSYVDSVDDGDDVSDFKDYIFETAMEAVYGRDVFKWINRRL